MVTPPFHGTLNMAVDVAIGELLDDVVLRFYSWSRPTLSLGRHQRIDDVDWEFVERSGFDVVRRPSGGRAVLHWDELTYSVVVPSTSEFFGKSVLTLYLWISEHIVSGLGALGFPVVLSKNHSRNNSELCFKVPSAYEVLLNGSKVVGSAQMRTQKYALQHGSIVLVPHEEVRECFKSTKNLDVKLTGLYDFKFVAVDDIIAAIRRRFELELGPAEPMDGLELESVMGLARSLEGNFGCHRVRAGGSGPSTKIDET